MTDSKFWLFCVIYRAEPNLVIAVNSICIQLKCQRVLFLELVLESVPHAGLRLSTSRVAIPAPLYNNTNKATSH